MRSLATAFLFAALAATAQRAPGQDGRDEMVRIPAGPFMMGSADGPTDERPAHHVTLPAFSIDRYPVTNAQFAVFLTAVGPLNGKSERLFDIQDPDARIRQLGSRWAAHSGFEQHPVVEVSWAGARDY